MYIYEGVVSSIYTVAQIVQDKIDEIVSHKKKH